MELRDSQVTSDMITGDFVWRGIAPLQRRSQPLWEARQEMGTRVSPRLLNGKMYFLFPGVPYDLPPGVLSLLDRPEGGDVVPPMPRCNAYGLQGTEFLDPTPVPKQTTARGRSLMAVGPPFDDFSPEEPGPFGDEDEEEAASEEQARCSPPASLRGEGEVPVSGRGAEVEPPPERLEPSNMPAG